MRKKKTKLNPKGRSVNEQFVKLPFCMLACPAYRSLKPGPRALLVEFHGRFNGRNNGGIIFSQREMAQAIKVSDRQTIAKYVRELEAAGFIKAMRRGGFNRKSPTESRATEWALTLFPIGDKPADKTFMSWRPEKNNGTEKPTGREGKSSREVNKTVPACFEGQEIPAVKGLNGTNPRAEFPSTYTSITIGREFRA